MSVPRNTFSPAFSHPGSNLQHQQIQRADTAITLNCQGHGNNVRRPETSFCPSHLPCVCMKKVEI